MNSFSLGMISKNVQGNTELEGYNSGLDICENFIIQPTGGVSKRSGTIYMGETYSATPNVMGSRATLIPFVYSTEQAYMCEFTDNALRFFHSGGLVLGVDDNPIVLVTAFTADEISASHHYQHENIMVFVTHKGIYELTRVNADEFTFTHRDGGEEYTVEPMGFMNIADIALKPLDGAGNPADGEEKAGEIPSFYVHPVKASNHNEAPLLRHAPLFKRSDIGRHITLNYLHPELGQRVYYLKILDVSEDTDHSTGVKRNNGFNMAQVRIVHETSSGTMVLNQNDNPTGEISYHLPSKVPVLRWQAPAFTAGKPGGGDPVTILAGSNPDFKGQHVTYQDFGRGTPEAATTFEGRLFLTAGAGIWGSSIRDNDFTDFHLGSNQSDGVMFRAALNNADRFLWLVGQAKLFAGTRSGVYMAGAATQQDDAITPANFRIRMLEAVGASPLHPVVAMDTIFFSDATGKALHEIVMGEQRTFQVQELSLLSADLIKSGIVSHTWQQNPTHTYWCSTGDGHLCSLTYLKNNGILAWAKHTLGGDSVFVESLATLPGVDGDTVWMVVKRAFGTDVIRCVEVLAPPLDQSNGLEFKQHYSDCGKVKYNARGIAQITRSQDSLVNISWTKTMHNNNIVYDAWSEVVLPLSEKRGSSVRLVFVPRGALMSTTLEARKSWHANNLTQEQVRLYSDFRPLGNPTIPYGKIKPDGKGFVDFPNDEHADMSVYVEVSHIKGIRAKEGGGILIDCVTTYLNDGDKVLLMRTGSIEYKYLESQYPLDYSASSYSPIFTVRRDGDNLELLSLAGATLELVEEGDVEPFAEIYKYVGNSTGAHLGTETLISYNGNGLTSSDIGTQVEFAGVRGMTEINRRRCEISWLPGGRVVAVYDLTMSPDDKVKVPLDSSSMSPFNVPPDIPPLVDYGQGVETGSNGSMFICFDFIGGLEHLNGQSVAISADAEVVSQVKAPGGGESHPYVHDGGIMLTRPVMFCSVGLPMKSVLKTLPFSGGSQLGSSEGSAGDQRTLFARLHYSAGGRYGTEESRLYDFPYKIDPFMAVGDRKKLHSGLLRCPLVNSPIPYERCVYIEHTEPVPFNLLSMVQEIQVSDA